MPRRKYQTPEIMHDAPLRDGGVADFHFDEFAVTLARLIASSGTETPLTIGINGAWGSGKTSLLLRVKNMLDKPADEAGKHRFANVGEKFRKCKTVWFDAWKYNSEDQLLVALIRVILETMASGNLGEQFWSKVLDKNYPRYNVIATLLSFFKFKTTGIEIGFDIEKYKSETPFANNTAFFDFFDEAFEELMARWVHGTGNPKKIDEKKGALVIFIDDLDRCLPNKVVQTLEALKLFLDKRGCVFVIGADIAVVQGAVAKHYEDTGVTGESAKDYLEKIIQLRFDLPPIVETAMESYLKSQKIVDKDMLKRWRTLIAAAEVNPRRVKNVINDLNLQWFMAKNSGQAEGVNRDDFICWQALMHAAPAAFVRQVTDFDDKTIRHSFIQDALKWQNGNPEDKEAVQGFFKDYEEPDSKRLRMVLKRISFSSEFTPETLNAMIYMTAPPAAAQPEPEKKVEEPKREAVEGPAEVLAEEKGPAIPREVLRGEKAMSTGGQNRRTVGNLEFVRVPKGGFVMGSKDDNELASDREKPQHTVDLTYDYWIAKYPLTNEQYANYLDAKVHPVEGWQEKKDHPVVNVSWDDAMAYCKWFNETFKGELGDLLLRLPTEAEWEKAARGAYGNEWPWGNEFDKNKCNSVEGRKGGTTPVGLYSSLGGDSPYGCSDMVGNVFEWTHSLFAKYPYEAKDGREVEKSSKSRVLRGGSFVNAQGLARCACRDLNAPDSRLNLLGFRVCLSSPSSI